ncbi:bifunctional diaminohydroxyphosphoribosylaminopyrimidine deaminase/5-amino-6-(5-phosphoribosylamino)uracil reductase RibD [uncultured Selenomonas sp.]|uniref:bifunctional diaminohydroxyphosphoribosylaminopyrimidine deaminase/5-amino-6-(5-phosphoribosylamino)uracil reductase RibD n=1 Tax=uncultured Selenomonas sp. TaxID=159275 RepID=UPI0025D51553|nr:bifunctional diaminohydroxyphosphoribosylaminopyrimidine deaminase/5-amino-6-(5-phosphoribosylamino)uracil reductase RibD [uncultured Selenomonas sp.]
MLDKEQQRAEDERFMREALRLARHAEGRTSPNPLVGAVIVKDGVIIAEGWHRAAGTPHAEVHALTMAGDIARGATLYVTLEPCAHVGRTGPCAVAVRDAGIRRVVAAMGDPNPKVAGKGFQILRDAGIDVTVGVCEAEARRLNEAFLHWITTGRPFVTMKYAMTLDGKIATRTGDSQWISCEASRRYVHALRDRSDAILCGIGTVLADNPSLTTRLQGRKGKNPMRVIVDSQARTPLTSNVVTDGQALTVIATTAQVPEDRVKALAAAGAAVWRCGAGPEVNLTQLMDELGRHEITSVLVEGGGTVNFSLLAAGLVQKVVAFVGTKLVGGQAAKTPVEGAGFERLAEAVELSNLTAETVGTDVVLTGYVKTTEPMK